MREENISTITNREISPVHSVTNNSGEDAIKKEQQAVALANQGQLTKAET